MRRLLVVVLAGLVVLTACGGGGGAAVATTTTARPFTQRALLVKLGNQVCADLVATRKQLVDGYLAQHQVTDEAATRDFLINSLAPAYDSAIGGLHRLYLPTEDPTEWGKIVDSLDGDLAAWRQTIESDPAGAVNGDPFADTAARMVAFGLPDCAKF
jgi:hypothetical protein